MLRIVLLLLALAISGCGQKGPLYLPKQDTPSLPDEDPELREY